MNNIFLEKCAIAVLLNALVDFHEHNPGVARGFLRTSQGKQEWKRKWAEIAISVNAINKDPVSRRYFL
ncbi:unnamed protein product [Chilo suppressalis]|uniref:Uncharacterized protein n=1 Tax=Chilo suppressalis TaxID=168631 RepID=A0ABN8B7K3_CHISP|nr:unnamed protein product [Chilo suppressalis]